MEGNHTNFFGDCNGRWKNTSTSIISETVTPTEDVNHAQKSSKSDHDKVYTQEMRSPSETPQTIFPLPQKEQKEKTKTIQTKPT